MNREIINASQENKPKRQKPKRQKPNAVADTVSDVLNKVVSAIAAPQHLPIDMSTRKPPRKQRELFVRIWTSWLHYKPFAVPITLELFEELWRAMAPAQMTRYGKYLLRRQGVYGKVEAYTFGKQRSPSLGSFENAPELVRMCVEDTR